MEYKGILNGNLNITPNNSSENIWTCRFHPVDWWHEVGCPHMDWTKEQLQKALITQKKNNMMKLDEIIKVPSSNNFQKRVHDWVLECFGEKISNDAIIRSFRFLEEAIELVQTQGLTKEECLKLVEYVYNRPIGEVAQEIGGTITTLAELCSNANIDMLGAGEEELSSMWDRMEIIRKKQLTKLKRENE